MKKSRKRKNEKLSPRLIVAAAFSMAALLSCGATGEDIEACNKMRRLAELEETQYKLLAERHRLAKELAENTRKIVESYLIKTPDEAIAALAPYFQNRHLTNVEIDRSAVRIRPDGGEEFEFTVYGLVKRGRYLRAETAYIWELASNIPYLIAVDRIKTSPNELNVEFTLKGRFYLVPAIGEFELVEKKSSEPKPYIHSCITDNRAAVQEIRERRAFIGEETKEYEAANRFIAALVEQKRLFDYWRAEIAPINKAGARATELFGAKTLPKECRIETIKTAPTDIEIKIGDCQMDLYTPPSLGEEWEEPLTNIIVSGPSGFDFTLVYYLKTAQPPNLLQTSASPSEPE